MNFFYYLVTQLAQYNDQYGFHANYFEDVNNLPDHVSSFLNSAFGLGVLYSCVLGAIVALAFYFCLCNGKSIRYAKRSYWLIGLALVACASYLIGDAFLIGKAGSPGTGFYASLQDYANNLMIYWQGNQQVINNVQAELNTIISNLNQGNDIALMYNITNAVLSCLVYFVVSVIVKRYTKHGSQIPF